MVITTVTKLSCKIPLIPWLKSEQLNMKLKIEKLLLKFLLQPFLLWDVLGERANRWIYSLEDLEDLVAFFSDSDDSDWSEYEIGSFE